MGWSDPSEVLSPAEELLEAPAPKPAPEAEPLEPEEPELVFKELPSDGEREIDTLCQRDDFLQDQPEEPVDGAQPFYSMSFPSSTKKRTKGKKKKKGTVAREIQMEEPWPVKN